MAQLPLPLNDRTLIDHQSLSLSINGVTYTSISDFNYDHAHDRGVFMGTSPNPLGYTDGTITPEASFTILAGDFTALIDDIADNDGQYGTAIFDMVATYKTRTSTEEFVVSFEDCLIGTWNVGHSAGPDPITYDVSIIVTKIDVNGLVAYNES